MQKAVSLIQRTTINLANQNMRNGTVKLIDAYNKAESENLTRLTKAQSEADIKYQTKMMQIEKWKITQLKAPFTSVEDSEKIVLEAEASVEEVAGTHQKEYSEADLAYNKASSINIQNLINGAGINLDKLVAQHPHAEMEAKIQQQ